MKERIAIMKPKRRVLKAATLGVLLAITALLITNPAKAFRPTAVAASFSWREFNFGAIGITRGQTARLSLLNLGREPINLSLNFTDNAGRLIKQSLEMVESGHAIFLDLTPATVDTGNHD